MSGEDQSDSTVYGSKKRVAKRDPVKYRKNFTFTKSFAKKSTFLVTYPCSSHLERYLVDWLKDLPCLLPHAEGHASHSFGVVLGRVQETSCHHVGISDGLHLQP